MSYINENEYLTGVQIDEVMGFIVSGFSYSEVSCFYPEKFNYQIKKLSITGNYLAIVRHLQKKKISVSLEDIRKNFNIKELSKKLRILCEKGYLRRTGNKDVYHCPPNIKTIENISGSRNCCRCHQKRDLLDKLSGNGYCFNCFESVFKYNGKHDIYWDNVKQGLLINYNIRLSASIYCSMLEQIQDVSISTVRGTKINGIYCGKELNVSRHLIFVRGVEVMVLYKNESNVEASFIVGVFSMKASNQ